jgi:hypothetical protein
MSSTTPSGPPGDGSPAGAPRPGAVSAGRPASGPPGIASAADLANPRDAAPERPARERTRTPGPAGLPSVFPWLALAATALIALSLLWLAAEQHYQGCVQAVQAQQGSSPLDRLVRQEQLADCSRLPF